MGDKVILLKRHIKTYNIVTERGEYVNGEWVSAPGASTVDGAVLPMKSSDLQVIDRGDVSFKDKKFYTKDSTLRVDDIITINGDNWKVFTTIEYGYIADLFRFVIKKVKGAGESV